jgi:signal transduction histidine kinase
MIIDLPRPRVVSRWRSAAYRIAVLYSLATAGATLLLGIAAYHEIHVRLANQFDRRVSARAEVLEAAFRRRGRPGLIDAMADNATGQYSGDIFDAIFDAQGRWIAGSPRVLYQTVGLQDVRLARKPGKKHRGDKARSFAVDLGDGSRLVVAADSDAVDHADRQVVHLFGWAFFGVVLVGAVGSLLLGAYLRGRLTATRNTAIGIMRGDLTQRVPTTGNGDEFDQQAVLVNAMLDRIALLVENIRQVSNDIAHDLRTPLARLRNEIVAAMGQRHDPARQEALLHSAVEQNDAILSLFAAMLRIAEIEEGSLRAGFRDIALSELMGDVCEIYAAAIEDDGRRLTSDIAPGIRLLGDRELIAQAVINLLDNAQRHTPPGTTIALRLEEDGDAACIAVTDDGPGIPPDRHDFVLRRFARLEESRSRPGHGLGLSLVAAIAHAHHGSLHFADAGPGLIARLRLAGRLSGTEEQEAG